MASRKDFVVTRHGMLYPVIAVPLRSVAHRDSRVPKRPEDDSFNLRPLTISDFSSTEWHRQTRCQCPNSPSLPTFPARLEP